MHWARRPGLLQRHFEFMAYAGARFTKYLKVLTDSLILTIIVAEIWDENRKNFTISY